MGGAHLMEVAQGRAAYADREWLRAWQLLSRADQLAPSDLELLARSAYMLGRDEDYVAALERCHAAYRDAGDLSASARCAWWIGHSFLFRGQAAPAAGWFQRGRRMLEQEPPSAAHGYLLIPLVLECTARANFAGAHSVACEVVAIGRAFGDRDLAAVGMMEQGHALVRLGRRNEGMALVDESMVAAATGELSPIVAGIVYCNTIAFCHGAHDVRRAREWTVALAEWCDQQPDMIAHQGLCLVHRAQILTLDGAWSDALAELGRLRGAMTGGVLNQLAVGKAHYARAEVHRLRGESSAAERAYHDASQAGCEPQPGLGLLWLARGEHAAAAAGIRRAVLETAVPLKRAALLPAYIEIMLALGDRDAAASACRELDEIAAAQGSELLGALAEQARGALALTDGDAGAALVSLRRAWEFWQGLGAPYEAARARVLLAEACLALGDEDAAALELECARDAFTALGARGDLRRVVALMGPSASVRPAGLSPRELEVLRLVAAGASNKEIAAALVLSERTVARHLQNIFVKLRVSSRTAASAYAFEHHLV